MTEREKLEKLVPKLYAAAVLEMNRAKRDTARLRRFPLMHRLVSRRYIKIRYRIRAHREASMLMTALAISGSRQLIKMRKTGRA